MHDTTRERFWALDIGYCASLKMRCFRRDGVARLMPDGPDCEARQSALFCSAPRFPTRFRPKRRQPATANTASLLHPDQLRVGVRAISFLLPRPKNQGEIHDASQIKQPKEEGGRGPRRSPQEDQAARERRPERQAKEERDAGEEGCRQGKSSLLEHLWNVH